MELADIKKHWDALAEKYAEDLKSTTKTPTIKALEINALYRAIASVSEGKTRILEAGCGNGHNIFGLCNLIPDSHFTGLDYSAKMIESAQNIKERESAGNTDFVVGDIRTLEANEELENAYDIVFTDRCIINLNTIELQKKAIKQMMKKTKVGGFVIVLENSIQNYRHQNDLREAVGLPRRTPVSYNVFIDEDDFLPYSTDELKLKLVSIDDFGSLHDIVLYVLLPSSNDGEIDYENPITETATKLLINIAEEYPNAFGKFGQNRLYLFQRTE